MSPPSHPSGPTPDDEAQLVEFAGALAVAVDEVIAKWIEGLVVARLVEWRGMATGPERSEAVAAGVAAREETVPLLRSLLETDIDRQTANPLAVLRSAVRHATQVLRDAGVPEVVRDAFDERAFPDDIYALSPATWADVDPSLHEPGLSWSAAKAFVFKARRRAEGRR